MHIIDRCFSWCRRCSHLSFAGCVKKTDACWVHDFSHPLKYRDAGGQSYYLLLLFYRCPIPLGLSLVGPFANYVDRSSGDTNAFTIGDKATCFAWCLHSHWLDAWEYINQFLLFGEAHCHLLILCFLYIWSEMIAAHYCHVFYGLLACSPCMLTRQVGRPW